MPHVILGILSDTHGRVATAKTAIHRLLSLGCEHLIHCGDLGDGVIELLPAGRSTVVFGNNDWDHAGLLREAADHDVACLAGGGTITLDGIRIAITHGDDNRQMRQLLADPAVRYLFTGHTHVAHDRKEGHVRWINPGALHRATRKSVATLDLETDELAYHEIATV